MYRSIFPCAGEGALTELGPPMSHIPDLAETDLHWPAVGWLHPGHSFARESQTCQPPFSCSG